MSAIGTGGFMRLGSSSKSKKKGKAKGRARSAGGGRSTVLVETEPGMVARRVVWVILAALWMLVAASVWSFNPYDPPTSFAAPHNAEIANWCGRVGAMLAYYTYQLLGYGVWVPVALAALGLGISASGRRISLLPLRIVGALMMAATVSGAQALFFTDSGPIRGLPGGIIGVNLAYPQTLGAGHEAGYLTSGFSTLGAGLFLTVLFCIAAVVALDVWALLVAMWTGRAIWAGTRGGAVLTARAATVAAQAAQKRREQWAANAAEASKARRKKAKGKGIRLNDVDDDEEIPGAEAVGAGSRRKKKVVVELEPLDPLAGTEEEDGEETVVMDEDEAAEDDAYEEYEEEPAAPVRSARRAKGAVDDDEEEEEEAPGAPQVFSPDALREKIAKLPMRFAGANKRAATEEELRDLQGTNNPEAGDEAYRFPGLDLLEDPEQNYNEKLESYVREQAESLEKALKEYRIDGTVVGIDSGPVITNFEVRLAPGTKVAALSAVSSDLARALKSVNIRIVPNTAGRDTVGVEVPNAIKEKVRLKELMSQGANEGDGTLFGGAGGGGASKMALPMFLGKDASGEPLIADLATMPHLLIAGTTGSGKSVCMNTVIMSFLYTKKPSELKLVLVDPKMVEMSQFKDIPHLMCPVVTEMSKAAAILEWAVNKMEERYALLAEAGCRDIAAYNAMSWDELKEAFQCESEEEAARIPRKLPYMVFIIDELADLMMTNKEVEQAIVRIAQKARAVGMHLILATQRPQANVVTGLIKSNLPARICFKVASGMDSRIVLDQKGGELLLGQGDMLYLSPRSSKLSRSQGTLVDDKEIRRVAKFMRDVAAPTFERQLMQIRSTGSGGMSDDEIRDGLANAQEDPLFDQAVEIVLETKRGSVSMLQRRLAIGYTRAARLIEMMGEAGILGAHKGTVAREIAMSLEEWHAIKAQAAADAEGGADGGAPTEADLANAKAAAGMEDEFADAFVDADDEPPFQAGRR